MNLLTKNTFGLLGWATTFLVACFALAYVASAQSATITSQMGPGDSGAQVSALQTFLASDKSVYPEGLVTGYYGSLTLAAVQRYQCNNAIVCSGDVATTGYGRVGPATLAKIRMQLGLNPGNGVTLPPVGFPPVSGDVNAPIVNAPTIATTSTSASITWNTNEAARSRVMYGTTWPFLLATAPSISSATGFSQTAAVTIGGLLPNTRYYIVPESVDASGNLQWRYGGSFTTNP